MDHKKTETKTKSLRNKYAIIVSVIGMVLSLIGIADATYLTIAHYTTKVVLACPSTGFIDCAKVTSSTYSEVLGIPAAVLGLVFFIGMLIAQLPMLWLTKNTLIRYGRMIFSSLGLVSVFWFVFVEFHRLHAICLYCTAVHILTFLLFVLTVIGTSITSVET